jgi:hypothetical protein
MTRNTLLDSLLFASLFFIVLFFADMVYTGYFAWHHVLRDAVVAVASGILFYLMTRKRKRKD